MSKHKNVQANNTQTTNMEDTTMITNTQDTNKNVQDIKEDTMNVQATNTQDNNKNVQDINKEENIMNAQTTNNKQVTNEEEVTMNTMTVESAQAFVKAHMNKPMTTEIAAQMDAARAFLSAQTDLSVDTINATVAKNAGMVPKVTKVAATTPTKKQEAPKATRLHSDIEKINKTAAELSIKALAEKYPVVKVHGVMYNTLQEAIEDGSLLQMLKDSAEVYHAGDLLAQVKVLRINLSSKKTNIKKGIGTHGNTDVEMLRIETLDNFLNGLYTELGGAASQNKYSRVSSGDKARYDLDDEDIKKLMECEDLAVLTAYYNSIASFKAKNVVKTVHRDGTLSGFWSNAAFARIEYMQSMINRRREILRKGSSMLEPVYAAKPKDWYDADEEVEGQVSMVEQKLAAFKEALVQNMLTKKKTQKLSKTDEAAIEAAVAAYRMTFIK